MKQEIVIQRKNIKNMYLKINIQNKKITLSAPKSITNKEIQKFIDSKTNWINTQIEKIKKYPIKLEHQYETGEQLELFGKKIYLKVRPGNKNVLTLNDDIALFTSLTNSTLKQRQTFILKWYRAHLSEQIETCLPKWGNITKLFSSSWQIKNMKTRWGTCNTKTKKIWLSLNLAKKPIECLDYVILHELLHLTEKNHNKNFYTLLTYYMPNWKEIENKLNTPTLYN